MATTDMLWDIFCKVIDNYGDIGVCWRLSADLAARGEQVRLWVDDPSALAWMAPGGHERVKVEQWRSPAVAAPRSRDVVEPGDVVIEAFGCELDAPWQAALAAAAGRRPRAPVWVNLEYLTAESFAERAHALPSPVMAGPAAGLVKHFFYPGFSPRTGGLLRETDLPARQAAFDRRAWLASHGVALDGDDGDTRAVSLFCYEPQALPALLARLRSEGLPSPHSQRPSAVRLLVTSGRAADAVRACLSGQEQDRDQGEGLLSVTYLPRLTQRGYDELLWACDLNFVRGEDSLVRALWAGKPFVWQAYPQDDGAHAAKLDAFLAAIGAPPSLAAFHRLWNGTTAASSPGVGPIDLAGWAACADAARARLLGQADLTSQLIRFCSEKSL